MQIEYEKDISNNMPLAQYRVLDLTDDKGYLCGRILADLGADVIKLEQPSGDSGRRVGPFYHDDLSPEKSLHWFAYNANKRSITLNIDNAKGQGIFLKLVRKSDVVLESFPPGYLDRLGLGYINLCEELPSIIMTSITPFGQESAWKHFKASGLVGAAVGGMMYITGDPQREPLRVGSPQSYLHASADAAVATLIALYHRELTGEGQHIDCSMLKSWICTIGNTIPFWELNKRVMCRDLYQSSMAPQAKLRQIWRCKDGFVCFALMAGASGAKTNRAICKWMEELRENDDFLRQFNWDELDFATLTQELLDKLEAPFEKFFAKRTKKELFERALELDLQVAPISTPEDLLDNKHLHARGYWQKVEHPELGEAITYPGAFVTFSDITPRPIKRAPLIGEHNDEIYKDELRISQQELEDLYEKGIV